MEVTTDKYQVCDGDGDGLLVRSISIVGSHVCGNAAALRKLPIADRTVIWLFPAEEFYSIIGDLRNHLQRSVIIDFDHS